MRLNAEARLYRVTKTLDGHGGETRTWIDMGIVYCRKWTPGSREIIALDTPDWMVATKRMENLQRRDRLLFVNAESNPLMQDEDGNDLCCELTAKDTTSATSAYQLWGAKERPLGN